MSQLTLPGLARKRRDLRAEANIPVAAAAHLTDDRDSAPSFDDLPDPVTKPLGYADIATDAQPAPAPQAVRKAFAYPGVSAEVMAWLQGQDATEPPAAPAARTARHDEHVFDADRLVPAGQLVAVALPAPPEHDPDAAADVDAEPPTVPIANPRLLFDALDQLPGLYLVDAEAFEMAASVAAIQTYVALRPNLLHTTGLGADVLALALHDVAALLDGEA